MGVDSEGRLRQSWGGSGLGNANDTTYGNPGDLACKLYPSLAFLAWSGQWFDYLARRNAEMVQPATHVSVFDRTPMRPSDGQCYNIPLYKCGPSATVNLPVGSVPWHQRFEAAHLDFSLSCEDARDVSCPQWDHVITLLGCCSAAGESCDAQRTGVEMGRWITTFGRGVGHWSTDITPIMPLIFGSDGGQSFTTCNFTVFTVPWAGNNGKIPWRATLDLRFSHPLPVPNPPLRPASVLQAWPGVSTSAHNGVYSLFEWIAFNQTYETHFPTFSFQVPEDTAATKLMVVLSGHGNDNHGCGEFCTTSHHFVINDDVALAKIKHNNDPDDSQLGCADTVGSLGTTPNEYGTWLYGRDGWCDGRPVYPWVADISDQVDGTRTNTLNYQGLFNGTIPDPSSLVQGSPVMMLRVFVVFYKTT